MKRTTTVFDNETNKEVMVCSDGGHAIKEHFNLPFLILKVMSELRFTFIGG